MADLSKDIQDRMNNVAFRFAHELRLNVRSVLTSPEFRYMGGLAASARTRVQLASAYEPPVIILEFEDYGEFIGKRKLLFTEIAPIQNLTKWVQDRGLDDGSHPVPGYTNGAPNLPAYKRASRIAWAIAISKKNETSKRLPKRWKRKALPQVLRDMNKETLRQFAWHIERLFKQSLETGA